MTEKPKLASSFKNNIGQSLGITEDTINNLIRSFYAKVKDDKYIDHLFDKIFSENPDEHLTLMCDFWSSITLSTERYKDQFLLEHINIPDVDKGHFFKWLLIFEENAYNVCSPEAAVFFIDRAKEIAESLMIRLGLNHGKFDS